MATIGLSILQERYNTFAHSVSVIFLKEHPDVLIATFGLIGLEKQE